ncbi:MAG: YSIRK-type signal peptide-containing protein [Eubacterium sp.]
MQAFVNNHFNCFSFQKLSYGSASVFVMVLHLFTR